MDMKFTSPRATIEETLAFANAVREAGGGNPLDALMPAVPSDPSQCLIAKNLNFNCRVSGLEEEDLHGDSIPATYEDAWVMLFGDNQTLRDTIANALDLPTIDSYIEDDTDDGWRRLPDYAIVLPAEIGQVAADFDEWSYALCCDWDDKNLAYKLGDGVSEADIERLETMAPYVEQSIRESTAIGVFNDKGELIL